MSSLIRPILASLLCGMIVLGHAPAWLHVGTCEGHGHASAQLGSRDSGSVCPHGCQHHQSPPEAVATGSQADNSGDHQHDSDTCVICQSLASPTGVTWQLVVPASAEIVSQPTAVGTESPFQATHLSIPQPRGPPTFA